MGITMRKHKLSNIIFYQVSMKHNIRDCMVSMARNACLCLRIHDTQYQYNFNEFHKDYIIVSFYFLLSYYSICHCDDRQPVISVRCSRLLAAVASPHWNTDLNSFFAAFPHLFQR